MKEYTFLKCSIRFNTIYACLYLIFFFSSSVYSINEIYSSVAYSNRTSPSTTYQTLYQALIPLSKFQSHKYNFNSKKLLIFQHIGLGSNSCNSLDTINGNTFTIDQRTSAVWRPFNSAFQSVCCYDVFFEISNITSFDVICISGIDDNFILGSLPPIIPPFIGSCSPQSFPFLSYDRGFTLIPLGIAQPIKAITIDPVNDNIIYAASSNNIYKSTNRGNSFTVISQINNLSKILKVSSFNSSYIFVSDTLVMQVSTNSGLSFKRLNVSKFREMYFYNDRPIVYGAGDGVFKSADNGLSWIQLTSLSANCIEINPDDSSVIYIGTDNGVYRSINGGQTFNHSEINFQNSNQIIGLSKDAGSGDTIIVCTQMGIYKVWDLQTSVTLINITVPEKYSLEQNYPNPFNPNTTITFSIPKKQFVMLIVYDLSGKEILTLTEQDFPAGTYSIEFDASQLSSGLYFYKLITNDFTDSKRMVLIK